MSYQFFVVRVGEQEFKVVVQDKDKIIRSEVVDRTDIIDAIWEEINKLQVQR